MVIYLANMRYEPLYKSFEKEQLTIKLPLDDSIVNEQKIYEKKEKKRKKDKSTKKEFPLVPDANDEFDITSKLDISDKFDVGNDNTFQM